MTAVPCNGGARCCRGDAVRLLPADFDADGTPRFQHEPHPYAAGALMVTHTPNGDCVYLDRATGCTIHADKSALCRSMDCRHVARLSWTQARRMKVLPIWRRGRDLRAAQPDPPDVTAGPVGTPPVNEEAPPA